MPTIVVPHRVGNFDTWLKRHQNRVELFSKFASGFKTFRDVNDPNSIVIVADVFDMPGMHALMRNSEVMKK